MREAFGAQQREQARAQFFHLVGMQLLGYRLTLPPASAARNASAPVCWAPFGPAANAGKARQQANNTVKIRALSAHLRPLHSNYRAAAIITGPGMAAPTVKVVSLRDIGGGTQFTDYRSARPCGGLPR